MAFRNFDALRIISRVADHGSLSEAANSLNLTKGALSYQLRQLEQELGFEVFVRHPKGLSLTEKGNILLSVATPAFDQISETVRVLRAPEDPFLTIGVTTYFASRWLSPRLTDFMQRHPSIRLRLQPMIDVIDFRQDGVDVAIRWGDGQWSDCEIEPLFGCPAWPIGNRSAMDLVDNLGIEAAMKRLVLLRDRDNSTAWSRWRARAGISSDERKDTLIIPDPNVRIQAVIDGQGIALADDLIAPDIESGALYRLHPSELGTYGYFLAYTQDHMVRPEVKALVSWIRQAALQ